MKLLRLEKQLLKIQEILQKELLMDLQAKEIDELLKRGAYDVFREDDAEVKAFVEADIDSILEGYGSYMKFKTREEEERMVEEHETYEAWFKVRSCSISEKLFFGAGVWRSHRVSPPVRQTVPECTN